MLHWTCSNVGVFPDLTDPLGLTDRNAGKLWQKTAVAFKQNYPLTCLMLDRGGCQTIRTHNVGCLSVRSDHDSLKRKFPWWWLKRRTDSALRLARNSPYATLFLGWISLTSPLFPPAARTLQCWAEAPPPLDINTVDQAREKNSCCEDQIQTTSDKQAYIMKRILNFILH